MKFIEITADEEIESCSVNNSFDNGNFFSNSSIILDKDTALNEEFSTKRKIEADDYDCV